MTDPSPSLRDSVKQKREIFEKFTEPNISPRSARHSLTLPRNLSVRFDDEEHATVTKKEPKNALRVSFNQTSRSKSFLVQDSLPAPTQFHTKAEYTKQIAELKDKLNEANEKNKILEEEIQKLRQEQAKRKTDEERDQELMVSSVQKTEAIIKKLLEANPANDRNAFIISDLAEDMRSLLNRQKAIERELEQNVYNNLQIAGRVERLQLQLQVYQEEKQRRYSDSTPPPQGEVTLVFTDVQGSTSQWEKDPITMATALRLHNLIVRRNLKKYGGYEVKTEGDAFMIAFAAPENAIQWCLETQINLLDARWPEKLFENPESSVIKQDERTVYRGLRVRMGVHLGNPSCEIDPVTGRMDYFGPVVNRSARVEGISQGGQIVVSGAVWDKLDNKLNLNELDVVDLGEHRLRGLETPTKLYQVLPLRLKDRTFVMPKASLTGELVSETEILRQDNVTLVKRLDELKTRFSELQDVATSLIGRIKAMKANDNDNLIVAIKELEAIIKEQDRIHDKIQKVEVNNGLLSTRVQDLNKSMSDSTAKENPEEIMDTKRSEIKLSDKVASLRQTLTDRQVMKEELSVELEKLNSRLLSELGELDKEKSRQTDSQLVEEKLNLQQQIFELSNKFDAYFTERQQLESQYERERSQHKEVQEQLEAKKESQRLMEEELMSSRLQLADAKRTIKKLEKERGGLQKKIASELTSIQRDRKELSEKISSLKNDVEQLKKQNIIVNSL